MLFRAMYIYYEGNQQKRNRSLNIQDSSYQGKEQEEKGFAIKKGNTGDFKDIAMFHFSSKYCHTAYICCIKTFKDCIIRM